MDKPNTYGVDLEFLAKIPLGDGVHLGATIYKPKGAGRTPVILTVTPYNTDMYHERGYWFARHGYAFAIVDCRGRGDSEGEFTAYENETQDGYDIVEWLAALPWCDGQVGMWGGSYAGANQWLTLKGFPPHLRTICPAAAPYYPLDYFRRGPGRRLDRIGWMALTSGKTAKWNLNAQEDFWLDKYRELYQGQQAFNQLDRVALGGPLPAFQSWLTHPTHDPYWDNLGYTPEQLRQINIPILTIAGHYDNCQRGSLHLPVLHRQWGNPASVSQHYIIIGPWDHAGTRIPQREFGGLRFGEAGQLNMNQLHKEWYDWTMRDGPKPDFLKNNVAYYVMAADEWKYTDSLETVATTTRRLHLSSVGGQANNVFVSGDLVDGPAQPSEPDRFVYDPLDPRPLRLARVTKNYLTDESEALNMSGNGLVYHSAPFEQATEVSGWVRLVVWLALDVPDTDLSVTLSEIQADGAFIKLTDDGLRARYRDGVQHEKLVPPGEIIRYEFPRFFFFSRRIAAGSRLRLVIKCVDDPAVIKNYNGGGLVENETGQDARTAHVTLYHNPTYSSYLELPFVS